MGLVRVSYFVAMVAGVTLASFFVFAEDNPITPKMIVPSDEVAVPRAIGLGFSLAPEPVPSCFGEKMDNFMLDQFPQVQNQGSRGTCYAHAASQVFEGIHYRRTGEHRSLSLPYITATNCASPSGTRMIDRLGRAAD